MTLDLPLHRNKKPWERVRGKNRYVERWPESKAAFVAFLTGQGYTSSGISTALGDGTNPATIRAMWKKWALPYNGKNADFGVPIDKATETLLAKRAATVGITPTVWCARVLDLTVRDDLYNAVVQNSPKAKKL